MSMDFLPSDDSEFLVSGDYEWKPLTENSKNGLVIRQYALPSGYIPEVSTLMLLIPPGYPISPLDMFYFSPGVSRKDGRNISALAEESHFGRTWQRWSRHYLNEWRPGIDGVATHITYVGNQLRFEIENR